MNNVNRILTALFLLLLATVATGQAPRNVTTCHHNTLQETTIAATGEDGAVKWTQAYSSYDFHGGNAQSTEASSNSCGVSGYVEDGNLPIFVAPLLYNAAVFIAKEAVLEYASRRTNRTTDLLSSRMALKKASKIFFGRERAIVASALRSGGRLGRHSTQGLETKGLKPAPGTRVQPERVPDNWRERPTNSGRSV